MYYVYVLRSKKDINKFYIGTTNNLKRRLREHLNPAEDQYTYRYSPWQLEVSIELNNPVVAKKLENYFKTSSGRTFIRKHLVCEDF